MPPRWGKKVFAIPGPVDPGKGCTATSWLTCIAHGFGKRGLTLYPA